MKLAWCGLLLVVGCHKHEPAAAVEGSGSTGSSEVSGSATTGSATSGSATAGSATAGSATAGSATAGSAAQAAGPQVAALDELDRWLAPIYKLDVPARYKRLCGSTKPISEKVAALKALGAPAGGDAQAWSDATDNLTGAVDGVKMCCKDLPDYEKAGSAAKEAADSNHDDCMKPVPDAFSTVIKLVPGAKPAGAHAGDPVMK